MHSPWDVFIGYMFAIYIILSLTSIPFVIGYGLYKILKVIKDRRME